MNYLGRTQMIKSRVMWAVVFLAASSMASAQDAAKSAPAAKAPAKAEQPATAAGGQSSGTVLGAETGTIGGVSIGAVAVVAWEVCRGATSAQNQDGRIPHPCSAPGKKRGPRGRFLVLPCCRLRRSDV